MYKTKHDYLQHIRIQSILLTSLGPFNMVKSKSVYF